MFTDFSPPRHSRSALPRQHLHSTCRLEVIDAPELSSFSSTTSGWYIRGDIGYNVSVDMDKPKFRSFDAGDQSYSGDRFDRARLDGDFSLNAGIGYQFNDWLRSDLTIDYFKASLDGKSHRNRPCSAGQPASTNCGAAYEQDVSGLGFAANGYADLGTYLGVTPYLGAGAGVTNVDYNQLSASKYCINGGGTCDDSIAYDDKSYEGADSWRFTYALMAGISYDVSPKIKIDLGYRFSQIDGGDMFDWSGAERRNGASGIKGIDNGLTRHEVRAGIRLTSW